jgi:inorganic triphosphatase YgiF
MQAPRLEQLDDHSTHYNEDPYKHSLHTRKCFRAEKKAERVRAEADRSPAELTLARADDAGAGAEARDEWACSRAEPTPEL